MSTREAAKDWFVISAKVRIDSSNHNLLGSILQRSQETGFSKVALDVSTTRFISFPAIKALSQFAEALKAAGGTFALIGPTERTKKHFEIYGSLSAITVLRGNVILEGEKVDLPSQDQSPDQGPTL